MKHPTTRITYVRDRLCLIPGFEPVEGLRVLGHTPVYYFRKRLDANGRLVIGRTRSRAIQLDDRSVSCRHAEIRRVDYGLYFLRDLGSRNGVKVRERGHYGAWVKQARDAKVVLRPGIHIKLGNVIVVPVDPEGKCPINVRDHEELARAAEETYGSSAAASKVVGRSRQWVRDIVNNAGRIVL